MRKKYLSALLFGALLFASAGTFTSCKDYDDDINNLQGQITANADAIKALQELVNSGKYVSGVAMEGQTITFTFSDGSTQAVVIPEGEKGQTVVVKDGELYIDDEATGIKVAEELETEVGLVKAENGTWWVLNENGEYTNTNIPVSGVTVSGSEKDGYTFTIYNEKGEAQTVKLPTAASSITEMTLGENVIQPSGFTAPSGGDNKKDFYISAQTFTYDNQTGESTLDNRNSWMGNKDVPADNDYIFASPSKIDLRIDPVNVPAENIQFYLTDTKNQDLAPVVLTASASQDSNSDPMTNSTINSRAAVTGNGLWTLSMANQVVSKNNKPNDVWTTINTAGMADRVYAVNANHAFRSEYKLNVFPINAETLSQISIKGEEATYTTTIGNLNGDTDGTATYKTGKAYEVKGVEASALYDMYLTADESDTKVYGLTFDQNKHTFTIGKNPDVSSIPAEFDLIIYTIANNGIVKKTVVTITLNSEISTAAEYGLHELDVNKDNNKNYFSIDLSTMKTALGDNLNQWLQNVDLTLTDIQWSDKENGTYGNLPTGITAEVVSTVLDKNNPNHFAQADRNTANFIQVDVDNSLVNGLDLDKTYYIKATFKRSANEILNSIVVPVEFHAPALSELFTIKEGYQEEGSEVINAYFYQIKDVVADGIKFAATSTQVYLDRYFSEYVPLAQVEFADGNVGETGHDGAWLFDLTNTKSGNNFGHATEASLGHMALNFDATNKGIKADGTTQNGYGEIVTINVTKTYFNTEIDAATGWNYTEDSDKKYSFQIRLMSPIAEGKVVPAEGSAINIDGNDLATGASITNEMIEGRTYNNVRYSIVPDDNSTRNATASVKIYETAGTNRIAATDYKDPQITQVLPDTDDDNYLQSVEVWSAYTVNKQELPGELKIKSSSISRDMTIQLPITVTDAWQVKTKQEVPVSIKFNK